MVESYHPLRIFTGSAHPELAKEIAGILHVDLGKATTRRMPGALCRQPPERPRARTKAAPRPRRTQAPSARRPAAFAPFPAELEAEREALKGARAAPRASRLLCWRASFFAWVRKLLALPAFGVSDRMRPGFTRKRFSSSALTMDDLKAIFDD